MFEELFKDTEEFAPTSHPKILRAKKSADTNPDFYFLLNKLEATAIAHRNEMITPILSKMLPEFKHSPNKINKVTPANREEEIPFSVS